MKKTLLLLIFLMAINLLGQIYPSCHSKPASFFMSHIWEPVFGESGELVENRVKVKIYYLVPHSLVAFQRRDEGYKAEYTLRSALYHRSRQVSGGTQGNSLSVESYAETTDNKAFLVDSVQYRSPVGQFTLFATFDDRIAGKQMEKDDIPIRIRPFDEELDLTLPLITDENGSIRITDLSLDDTVYFSVGIIAPESDDIIVTASLSEGKRFEFKAVDTLTTTTRSTAFSEANDRFSFPHDFAHYFKYRGSFCVCGEEDIHGGEKIITIAIKNANTEKSVEKSIKANFRASYVSMSRSDFSEELHLLSIIGRSREIRRIRRAKPEERDSLIEKFWAERDPNPSTEENEFKEEFLRRVQYANDNYSGWRPGYKTDRGRVYIERGPPDEIQEFPFEMDSPPYEKWYYYSTQTVYTFIDRHGTGEYTLWSIN